MIHIPIALLIQFILSFPFGWWAGALAGTWYFIGREYAQAEYRLIEQYYEGKRDNLPTLAALKQKRAWTKKSVLDWVLPAIATTLLAFYMQNKDFVMTYINSFN
jgi:hypothetical protein